MSPSPLLCSISISFSFSFSFAYVCFNAMRDPKMLSWVFVKGGCSRRGVQ